MLGGVVSNLVNHVGLSGLQLVNHHLGDTSLRIGVQVHANAAAGLGILDAVQDYGAGGNLILSNSVCILDVEVFVVVGAEGESEFILTSLFKEVRSNVRSVRHHKGSLHVVVADLAPLQFLQQCDGDLVDLLGHEFVPALAERAQLIDVQFFEPPGGKDGPVGCLEGLEVFGCVLLHHLQITDGFEVATGPLEDSSLCLFELA